MIMGKKRPQDPTKKVYMINSDVTICFPEYFEETGVPRFEENPEGTVNGDCVSFTRKGCRIDATFFGFSIPYAISELDLPEIRERIIKPAVKQATNDVKTIDGNIEELRELARKGVAANKMYYKQISGSYIFEVYDYSVDKLFEKMMELKDLEKHREMVRKEFHFLLTTSLGVKQEDNHLPYVSSIVLKDAVEEALTIYREGDTIMDLLGTKGSK